MLSPNDVLAIHRPTCTLTPKGETVTAAYRFLALLRELDADERRDCLELLQMELDETFA